MSDEANDGSDSPLARDERGRELVLDEGYALNALPGAGPRALAFAAIVVGGVCGALIGYAVADLGFDGAAAGLVAGAVAGALIGAGGVAVVAVLVLRAMSEWNEVAPADDRDR